MELEINDLDCLEKAVQQLGLELVRGQTHYKWFGRSVGDYPMPVGFKASDLGKCEHAIRIPGNSNAYEIGVVKRKDGRPGYQLLWDFWQGGYGMQEKVGTNGDKLKQHYTAQYSMKSWQKKGYRVSQTTVQKEDGLHVVVKASR